jgi:glycerate 2-kinase
LISIPEYGGQHTYKPGNHTLTVVRGGYTLIIKNYEDLISHGEIEAREVALGITETVLDEADPGKRLRSIVRREQDTLIIRDREYDLTAIDHIYIIGVGKGAFSLVKVLTDVLGKRVDKGILVTKRGEYYQQLEGIEVIESTHPLPSEDSIRAGEAVLDLAESAKENDLVLTAVTGGASSLLWLPPDGVPLQDIVEVSALLLKSGASIGEVNTVRRHLCLLKGGKLLSHIHPAENITFSMVTVPPWVMPWPDLCLPDDSTFQDAIDILKMFDVWDRASEAVQDYLERGCQGLEPETLKSTDNIRTNLYSVLDPAMLCEIGAERAESFGYTPVILSRHVEGEAKDVGMAVAGIANEIGLYGRPWCPPCVLLIGGEVTVTVGGAIGDGGPNQEFVLGFAKGLGDIRNVACVAVDTDGSDGATDIAGGIVDGLTKIRARERGISIAEALRTNTSKATLEQLGDAIITGPTGTNVLDFKVIVIGTD